MPINDIPMPQLLPALPLRSPEEFVAPLPRNTQWASPRSAAIALEQARPIAEAYNIPIQQQNALAANQNAQAMAQFNAATELARLQDAHQRTQASIAYNNFQLEQQKRAQAEHGIKIAAASAAYNQSSAGGSKSAAIKRAIELGYDPVEANAAYETHLAAAKQEKQEADIRRQLPVTTAGGTVLVDRTAVPMNVPIPGTEPKPTIRFGSAQKYYDQSGNLQVGIPKIVVSPDGNETVSGFVPAVPEGATPYERKEDDAIKNLRAIESVQRQISPLEQKLYMLNALKRLNWKYVQVDPTGRYVPISRGGALIKDTIPIDAEIDSVTNQIRAQIETLSRGEPETVKLLAPFIERYGRSTESAVQSGTGIRKTKTGVLYTVEE